MVNKFSLSLAGAALVVVPTVAYAASSFSYNLRATVPVHCSVQHSAAGFGGGSEGSGISLGTFREYCNAPGGYELLVRYTPGTLRGARIIAGSDTVVLDGSGQAVLSRSTGPRIRERTISAIPGERGFDTQQLQLDILPTV
ncbi:hypothetical protein KK137_15595 [Croceibacterium sp. LX-88]|jgi:hypothetical protein|uniref:Spore coat protein U domain-containing protein n=1 Tax=Croceibacterium selenioxidans TaxID=2838833 RepID=A0ABS5W9G3_9SPHN|nr:hypothetical protein [Croceibacterium selenioxidans]MBT2135762.1 hypothetical protein [Croceibacterium selenioxidans]